MFKRKKRNTPDEVRDTSMKTNRKILQVVPATDWDAICAGPDLRPFRIKIAYWAITEMTEPISIEEVDGAVTTKTSTFVPLSLVAGLDADFQPFDEKSDFFSYAHKSTSTEEVVSRFGDCVPRPGEPVLTYLRSMRVNRMLGERSAAEYPNFDILQEVPDLKNLPLTLDYRRLLAIIPAIDAYSLFSIDAGRLDRQPIAVWALIEDIDGSHKVVGIGDQTFPCDEWTNFVGYEPQPPKPEDFQNGHLPVGGLGFKKLKAMLQNPN